MPELLPKVGVLLACFLTDAQIWILVQCTVFFDWKEFQLLSYRRAFLESTKISASKEQNALEKAPVQFMVLQILSISEIKQGKSIF